MTSEVMTEEEFFETAQAAFDSLPREFRQAVGNITMQIVDWPSRETLRMMDLGSPYDLLGLYHGIGLPFKSVFDMPHGPDMIQLYRQPILAYAETTGEAPERVIRHVLIHELGHHFGFSDADMEAIEAGA